MLQLEAGLEAGRRGFKTMQFKMLYEPNGRSAEELVMNDPGTFAFVS